MNFQQFDDAVYKKCGHLSVAEQALTGYKSKNDMDKSYAGLYRNPRYQNEFGSGEYKIKGSKDLPKAYRTSKKKLKDFEEDEKLKEEKKESVKKIFDKLSKYEEAYEDLEGRFERAQKIYESQRELLQEQRKAFELLGTLSAFEGYAEELDEIYDQDVLGAGLGEAEGFPDLEDFEQLNIAQKVELLTLSGIFSVDDLKTRLSLGGDEGMSVSSGGFEEAVKEIEEETGKTPRPPRRAPREVEPPAPRRQPREVEPRPRRDITPVPETPGGSLDF